MDTKKVMSGFEGVFLSDSAEITPVMRDAPPSHYTLKIQSFSLFSELEVQKYKSGEFELEGCDYKWYLVLYPNGDKRENITDHISLYLAVANTGSLRFDWGITVSYRFFILDQIRDKYLSLGDVGGVVRRFHSMKNKWGFPKLISFEKFKAAENGFLVNDNCLFGVEIFAVRDTVANGSFIMLKNAACYGHTWQTNWSGAVPYEYVTSQTLRAGDYNWIIRLYPNGDREAKNKNVSLFIYLAESDHRVLAEITMRVLDRTDSSNHLEIHGCYWFNNRSKGLGNKTSKGWGTRHLIAIDKFKSYVVRDIFAIEAEITVHGSCK